MTETFIAKRNFDTLDALRGIAAFAVVLHHLGEPFGYPLVANGPLAVDLFFVMSGVVIAHAYQAKIRRGMTVAQFSRVRMVRLYPLYIAGTLITAAGVGLGLAAGLSFREWSWGALLSSLISGVLMLPDVTSPVLYPLNFPAWSLFFELLINLVFVVWLAKASTRAVGIVALAGLVGLLMFAWRGVGGGSNWQGSEIALLRVTFSFPLGVWLFRKWKADPKISTVASSALALTVGTLLISSDVGGVWPIAVPVAAFPMIVWIGMHVEPGPRWVGACRWLGVISYPLYVLHIPVMYMTRRLFEKLAGDPVSAFPWLMVPLVALIVVLAQMANRWYDAPIRAKLARRRQAGSTAAAR